MVQQVERQRSLDGKSVAVTGRLASMVREEATRRIHEAGGRYVTMPSWMTDLLVVGEGGPPLGDDGHLTQSLLRARELHDQGARIRIVSEEEFLSHLGLEHRQQDLHRLYTTAQLARILGVPQCEIRAWIRHDLLKPVREVKRLCWFDFQQASTARRLSDLTRGGVTPHRLRQSLLLLGSWFPSAENALVQLERLERSGRVLVRLEDGNLAEPSGQLWFDFEPKVSTPTIPLPKAESADWFERGVRAEEDQNPDEAAFAYEQAIESGDALPEVRFNLGNVLYSLDRLEESAQRFREALEREPEYVEAWNNLGNALCGLGLHDDAVRCYRRALAIAPDYADAHYNLGETLATLGDVDSARKHWLRYLEYDPSSAWAQAVRERLVDPTVRLPID